MPNNSQLTCKRCGRSFGTCYPDRLEMAGAEIRHRVRLTCKHCRYVTTWCPPAQKKPASGIDPTTERA